MEPLGGGVVEDPEEPGSDDLEGVERLERETADARLVLPARLSGAEEEETVNPTWRDTAIWRGGQN